MEIRRATASDVPDLVALNGIVHKMHAAVHPEVFRQNPPDEAVANAFRSSIESPSSYWLLAEEGQIAGFLNADFCHRTETWLTIDHHVCYLGGIVVLPSYRRRGIAKSLLAELKREANFREITRIELDVWSFNAEAKQAFLHLGFYSVREKMAISTANSNNKR